MTHEGDETEQNEMTFEDHIKGHVAAIIVSAIALTQESTARTLGELQQEPNFQQLMTSIGALILQPLADLNRISQHTDRMAVAQEQLVKHAAQLAHTLKMLQQRFAPVNGGAS